MEKNLHNIVEFMNCFSYCWNTSENPQNSNNLIKMHQRIKKEETKICAIAKPQHVVMQHILVGLI